jgi:hypothetical protein
MNKDADNITPETLEKIKSMLPSKKFSRSLFLLVGIVLAVIIATSFFGSHRIFFKNKNNAPVKANGTVADVVTRDSNENGITDWEESLWGLDPEGDGATNKKIIEQKKLAAGIAAPGEGTTTSQTATDQFVQEFLSTILALNQSGSLTPEAVANLADALGKHIDTKRTPEVIYDMTDLQIATGDQMKARKAYAQGLVTLTKKYQTLGIGTELDIIARGLEENTTDLGDLGPIASAYRNFGRDLTGITVPKSAALMTVDLANASVRAGTALDKAATIYSDALTGMVGIDDFLAANKDFERATERITDYLNSQSI